MDIQQPQQTSQENNQPQEVPKSKSLNVQILLIEILALMIIAGMVFYGITVQKGKNNPGGAAPNQNAAENIYKDVKTSNEFLEVAAPLPGQKISSPVTVSGKSNFFEANTQIRIKDGNGKVIADAFATAEGWMDKLYPFSQSVSFPKPGTEKGTVEIFESSPADGKEKNVIVIPVVFTNFSAQGNSAKAGWEIYENKSPKYSIQYPSDWKLDASQAEMQGDEYAILHLTLEKKNHKIIATMPSGWGPAVCQFKDTPGLEDGPSIKLPGNYVEIKTNDYTLRRIISPEYNKGKNAISWIICQKEKNSEYFTNNTVLAVLNYETPANYDSAILKEMDEILKTVKK